MEERPPSVYLFHGDDGHAINREINLMTERLGDQTTAELNLTWLEGHSFSLDELGTVANTAPFLAERRMVVLLQGLQRIKDKKSKTRFIQILENIPKETALVIQESPALRKDHWMLKWAQGKENLVFVRNYRLPQGREMARWIRDQTRNLGGDISQPAAGLLADLVGKNKHHADGEIAKMLAYVNYQRPIEVDDVQYLYSSIAEEDISQVFKMVDALGNKDRKTALDQLHQLLHLRDPLSLFGMIVRQIRLLLLAREILDGGSGPNTVQEKLRLHPYVTQKVVQQARNFTLPTLESHFRDLLDLDYQIKTGRIEATTALDTWIVGIIPPEASFSH